MEVKHVSRGNTKYDKRRKETAHNVRLRQLLLVISRDRLQQEDIRNRLQTTNIADDKNYQLHWRQNRRRQSIYVTPRGRKKYMEGPVELLISGTSFIVPNFYAELEEIGRKFSITVNVFFYCFDGVRLCLCGTGPLMGPLPIPQMIHE
jgi:hypothetical protein